MAMGRPPDLVNPEGLERCTNWSLHRRCPARSARFSRKALRGRSLTSSTAACWRTRAGSATRCMVGWRGCIAPTLATTALSTTSMTRTEGARCLSAVKLAHTQFMTAMLIATATRMSDSGSEMGAGLLGVDLLLMNSQRQLARLVCFLAGCMGLALTVGLLDVLVVRADAISTQGSISAGLDLTLGVPLLVIGALVATGHIHGRRRAPVPVTTQAGAGRHSQGARVGAADPEQAPVRARGAHRRCARHVWRGISRGAARAHPGSAPAGPARGHQGGDQARSGLAHEPRARAHCRGLTARRRLQGSQRPRAPALTSGCAGMAQGTGARA